MGKLSLSQAAPIEATKLAAKPVAPGAAENKLAALTQSAATTAQLAKPAPKTEAANPVDLSKADEKLSSLLGGKK